MERAVPSRRFGAQLSPVNCRRPGTRPVGCYAVLGRVAASGPTSWLSARPDILGHSAATWGPWRAVWAVPLSGAELSSRVLTPGVWARRRSEFGSLRQAATPPRGSGGSTAGGEPPGPALKLFRGERDISGLVWPFTPTPGSSPPFSTDVGSGLHGVSPPLRPAPGWLARLRVRGRRLESPCSDSLSLRLGSTFASPPAATRWLILQ